MNRKLIEAIINKEFSKAEELFNEAIEPFIDALILETKKQVALNELSRETLGRYINRASNDAAINAMQYGQGNSKENIISWKHKDAHAKKASKRLTGTRKAVDKLTGKARVSAGLKEEVEKMSDDDLKKSWNRHKNAHIQGSMSDKSYYSSGRVRKVKDAIKQHEAEMKRRGLKTDHETNQFALGEGHFNNWSVEFEEKYGRSPTNDDFPKLPKEDSKTKEPRVSLSSLIKKKQTQKKAKRYSLEENKRGLSAQWRAKIARRRRYWIKKDQLDEDRKKTLRNRIKKAKAEIKYNENPSVGETLYRQMFVNKQTGYAPMHAGYSQKKWDSRLAGWKNVLSKSKGELENRKKQLKLKLAEMAFMRPDLRGSDTGEDDGKRYKVKRFYKSGRPSKTIAGNLSLGKARGHAKDPETSSRSATGRAGKRHTKQHGDWFDGYDVDHRHTRKNMREETDTAEIQKQIDKLRKYKASRRGNTSSVRMLHTALDRKIATLQKKAGLPHDEPIRKPVRPFGLNPGLPARTLDEAHTPFQAWQAAIYHGYMSKRYGKDAQEISKDLRPNKYVDKVKNKILRRAAKHDKARKIAKKLAGKEYVPISVSEAHTASELYSKAKSHEDKSKSENQRSKYIRLGVDPRGYDLLGFRKRANKVERKANQHAKASDAAKRLLASLKVTGKKNTSELNEISIDTARKAANKAAELEGKATLKKINHIKKTGYKEPDVRELMLHADNDQQMYNSSHKPIKSNLAKKKAKGIYDPEKAKKLWGHHANRAAQSYHKQHGSRDTHWHKMFSTADRREAARRWAEKHDSGDYD